MSVKITGINRLLGELEAKLGKKKMESVTDASLMAGAKIVYNELQKEFAKFKDTGASMDEMKISEPSTVNGVREIRIYWQGPKNRRWVIHLNEFGTIRNPNPRGKGAVARAIENSWKPYAKALRDGIRRGM